MTTIADLITALSTDESDPTIAAVARAYLVGSDDDCGEALNAALGGQVLRGHHLVGAGAAREGWAHVVNGRAVAYLGRTRRLACYSLCLDSLDSRAAGRDDRATHELIAFSR
jgi:hypothetical protein